LKLLLKEGIFFGNMGFKDSYIFVVLKTVIFHRSVNYDLSKKIRGNLQAEPFWIFFKLAIIFAGV